MGRPCSSHVYQLTPTPASSATSSRRSPGVRRRGPGDRPASSGRSLARRALRKPPSSARRDRSARPVSERARYARASPARASSALPRPARAPARASPARASSARARSARAPARASLVRLAISVAATPLIVSAASDKTALLARRPGASDAGPGALVATGCRGLRRLAEGVEEAEPVRGGRGLAAARDPELAEDVGHVHAGRLRGDEQLAGDLGVAPPGRHEPQHLELAGR